MAKSKTEVNKAAEAEAEAKKAKLAAEEEARVEAERVAAEEEAAKLASEEEARVAAEAEAEAEAEKAKLAEQAKLADSIKEEQSHSPLFGDSIVAKTVGESIQNYLDSVKNTNLSLADRIKRQTGIVKVFNNIPKIAEGKDCIATLDLVLKLLRLEIGEGGAFSESNAHQHAAQVTVFKKGIAEYQMFMTWITVILGHLDTESKVSYEKDFSEEALQEVYPGEVGERLVAYGRRVCGVNK